MYLIDRPTPYKCSECKHYVRHEIAYDNMVGCVFSVNGADLHRKDRPVECPIVDIDDDLK